MPIIDVIFLIVLSGFALFGLWFGLVHTLGSLVGTIIGTYLASRWFDDVAVWAQGNFSGSINVWKVIAFILVFIIINRLIGFLFHILENIFGVITRLPFIQSINKLAGAILGVFEGSIIIGAFVFIASRFPFGIEEKLLAVSVTKQYFLSVFDILLPFIPQTLKIADTLVK